MMIPELSTPITPSSDPTGLPEVECCWCGGPIAFDDESIAWCANTEACREKQRRCGVRIIKDGKEKWFFLPTPKQTECLMCWAPNLFVHGNRGGGKSACFRKGMAHPLAMAIPGFKYAILRTSYVELQKNHLEHLDSEKDELGGEDAGYRYNKTDHIFYYPNGSLGYYAQCATEDDVKKILGAEVALVIFDEAPTFDWGHMQLIAASLRAPTTTGIKTMARYLGNPIGDSIDELWNYFIDKEVDPAQDDQYSPDDWVAIEMRIQDNPYLDRKAYWKRFGSLPPHYRKAWLEGLRVEENALFDFWPEKEEREYHVVSNIPRIEENGEMVEIVRLVQGVNKDGRRELRWQHPSWVRIYRAYDHGYYPDPAVCLWFAVYGRRIVCFKEIMWLRTTAENIAKEIVDESRGMSVVTTYIDPSLGVEDGVETVQDKLEMNGVPTDLSLNDREWAATVIHSALGTEVLPDTPKYTFLKNGCPGLIKAIPRMKYKENNPAAMADHKLDHWPIAFAYFAGTTVPTTEPSKPTKKQKYELPKTKHRFGSDRMRSRYS